MTKNKCQWINLVMTCAATKHPAYLMSWKVSITSEWSRGNTPYQKKKLPSLSSRTLHKKVKMPCPAVLQVLTIFSPVKSVLERVENTGHEGQ